MYTIINAIILSVATLFGVWLGSHLSRKNNLKLEKHFLIKKIEIDKTQELIRYVLEYCRTIAKMNTNVVRYLSGDIDHENFKSINNQLQDEGTRIQRSIVANKVFNTYVEKELELFLDKYIKICDKIYEKYNNPETKSRRYNDNELEWDVIDSDFTSCLKSGTKIIEESNEKLKKNLKELGR